MGLLQEQLRQIEEAKAAKEKHIRDGRSNRKQFLISTAEANHFGTNVEGFIEAEKAKQPLLQPKGFWDYPDPANALDTTEEGLNPKEKDTYITLPKSKIRARTSHWDRKFNPQNRG